MFFVTLAATLMLAGADQAQPAAAEAAAAAPAPAAAPDAKPKTRRVCYVDPKVTGSRMQKKHCVEEPIDDKSKTAETAGTK